MDRQFIVSLLKLILLYQLGTAAWPLLSIESFMMITGYKTDQWLVKTVALLLICINSTAIYCLMKNKIPPIVITQQIAMSTSLIFIDIYYSLKDVISDIYLLDAPVQFFSVILWIFFCKLNFINA